HEERNYSEDIARRIDNEVRRIIDGCYARARDIIVDQRDTLERLVEVLLEQETLDQEEVAAIMAGEELPPEKVKSAASERLAVPLPPPDTSVEKRTPLTPRPVPDAPSS
ncbi:MAG: cell division protein FtsH, partial [Armatimonadota bacterium]